MWWNLIGLAVAVLVTYGVSRFTEPCAPEQIARYTLGGSGFFRREPIWRWAYGFLVLWFFALLASLFALNRFSESVMPVG